MTLRTYLRSLYNDFHARRRGEVRIAPRGVRGRIYAPINPPPEADPEASPTTFINKKQPIATLTMTVTRADGTVETIVVPAQVVQVDG